MTVPLDPATESRIRNSFAKQALMGTLGIELADITKGAVNLTQPFTPAGGQQHGFHHAATTTAGLDSACGYAAMTMMAAMQEVLTVEYKVTLIRPAKGSTFRYEGRVLKPGRTLTFTEGRAFANDRLIATMTATMAVIEGANLFT
ncbi:MAG: PaaI family thioesterase [Shimia sp.]